MSDEQRYDDARREWRDHWTASHDEEPTEDPGILAGAGGILAGLAGLVRDWLACVPWSSVAAGLMVLASIVGTGVVAWTVAGWMA